MKGNAFSWLSALALSACMQQSQPAPESCAGQCTVLTGRLLTSGQHGLAGATVTAALITPGGGLGSLAHTKARATTDGNGNYQLRFFISSDELASNYYTVLYTANKQQYYVLGEESIGLSNLKRDTTYQLPPYLIPRVAVVTLTVPNAAQIQESFWLDFSSAHGRQLTPPSQKLGGGEAVSVLRQNAPFMKAITVAADQLVYVRALRSTGSTHTITLDSLVVPAGTTYNLTVTY